MKTALNLNYIIGKTVEQAEKELQSIDMIARITMLDGEGQIGTCDFRMDRANLTVENNIVTEISVG